MNVIWLPFTEFRYFVIISLWKRTFVQTWIPKDLLHQVCLNWPNGSGQEDFKISSMYFRYYLSFGKGVIHPHQPKMCCAKFGWNWLIGSGLVFRRSIFSLFCHYSRLEKKDAFCQVWLKNHSVVLEKRMKIWKVYIQMQTDGHKDGQTDDRHSEKLKWAFSPGELKCLNCQWYIFEKYR